MLKEGWKTTEFWIAAGTNFVGMLLLFGVAGPGFYTVIAGAALSCASVLGYSWARGQAKGGG